MTEPDSADYKTTLIVTVTFKMKTSLLYQNIYELNATSLDIN